MSDHTYDIERVSTLRVWRGLRRKGWHVRYVQYWHATYRIAHNHLVLGTGSSEVEALRCLAAMLYKCEVKR